MMLRLVQPVLANGDLLSIFGIFMPNILRNKLFRNWFGHPVQSLRSLCSLILQCRILKSWIRARINECMSYCTKMNEWPLFYHYYGHYIHTTDHGHANVCKIQNSSFMHKCVFLLRPHKWLDFNDALIFFFCSAYMNGVNFQHCIYNLLHVDSWKCNIFRAQSTDWNYSSGAHSTKRAELKAASE